MPTGLLVLPSLMEKSREPGLLDELICGRIPGELPEEWKFYALALAGDTDRAYEDLRRNDSKVAAYNRYVLRPAAQMPGKLPGAFPFPLSALGQAVAYAAGISDELPAVEGLYGEYRGMVLSTWVAAAIHRGEAELAIQALRDAIKATRTRSPLLAAQLLGQLAGLIRDDESQWTVAVQYYREALSLAVHSAIVTIPAELWFELGGLYQLQAQGRRGPLLESVRCYQNGLQCGVTLEAHPLLYAHAQSQIGLAYLAMPLTESSDQLRTAIAVQSLREALKVYDKQTYPQRWAMVQLNLANAHQYLPSAHPQENLIEAVKIYDDVLTVRDKATDPSGYARVLLNQSNALAHLGIFAPALEKLSEAHKLFHWHNESELANSAMELANQIHAKRDESQDAASRHGEPV